MPWSPARSTCPRARGWSRSSSPPCPPRRSTARSTPRGPTALRVLSTRYRTRAVKEDTRKEVRAKEEQIKTLKQEAERLQKEIQVIEQNLQLLAKLESFTGATMQHLTEKGLLEQRGDDRRWPST